MNAKNTIVKCGLRATINSIKYAQVLLDSTPKALNKSLKYAYIELIITNTQDRILVITH